MNQIKTGELIKELRKEKQLTQEQMAEQFNVSRRTVSRWETGNNLPDLDILIEISDFFDVDLRELLDGERKCEEMNKEMEETVLKVADYNNKKGEKQVKTMLWLFSIAIVCLIANTAMALMDLPETFWTGFAEGGTIGFAIATMVLGILYTTGKLANIQNSKKRVIKKLGGLESD